ncbi:Flp pilus assembly protein CpaB [Phenylobacterium hankyongense]|uniref:Flp pilus assembly protein CpaB n=1 Tax=Phenylobacterium hankyongense TaxID=1813876 RepID=A0A328B0A5_9CAUL|nr:Flp pilus assembly protein CpaB [Phenylobacterium hankyongense]RAK60810.1 Flp pilus assembly protein CpaB [Phenylobacterium hankyongense]
MRNIGFILLIVSLLLGGVAVWGVRNLSAARAAPDNRIGQTTVVVASRPIGFGETLTPELLRVQAWPRGAQPQGSFRTPAELTTGQKRVALSAIAANEPVLATRISGPGGRATLSGVIRGGMRATTIRVNDVFGVAGFVLPGDFVDVLLTRTDAKRPGAAEADMRTDLLLQSVRVLAVDQLANENKNDPVVAKAATIEVTPDQAQKLALAAQVGTLSLALRGAVDPLASAGETGPGTTRIDDLRLAGAVKPQPVRIAARRPVVRRPTPPGAMIQIYRGAQSVVSVLAPREASVG